MGAVHNCSRQENEQPSTEQKLLIVVRATAEVILKTVPPPVLLPPFWVVTDSSLGVDLTGIFDHFGRLEKNMKRTLPFILAILSTVALCGQSNPVPFINQPLVPTAVTPGSLGFTLMVNGANFQSNSTVYWNGSPRATTFNSPSQLTADITSADVAAAGTAIVTVANVSGAASNFVSFPVAASRSALSFSTMNYSVGTNPNFVAVGDFNEDGNLDLAVSNETSNTISILLGNGDGTFKPHVDYAAESEPIEIVTGDFNNDGHLDFAVANDEESISIFLGNGDGTFQPQIITAVTLQAFTLAVGDLNGDGKLDVVVGYINYSTTTNIGVLLGNGDGTFQPIRNYPAGGTFTAGAALADLRNNGLLDVVVSNPNENTISVLFGNGDGTFQSPVTYAAETSPNWNQLADFNQDGYVDIANANAGSGFFNFEEFLNRGDGTFSSFTEYGTGNLPQALVSADFNGDGKLDVASSSGSNPNFSISVLLGNGDGTFQTFRSFYAGPNSNSLAVGDFNHDGMLDLVTNDYATNQVSVLLQDNGTVVSLSANQLTFPTQVVGTVSAAMNVVMTNNGSASIAISNIGTTANFSSTNNCGKNLAKGARCTIKVYFTPSTEGDLTGLLTIFDNGGGSPQTVSMTGVATVLSIVPSSLNFGTQKVHTSSAPQAVTVANTGSTTVHFTGITVTGRNAADFLEVNACGSLAAGTICQISVTFRPRATGARSAIISISDNGGGSPQKVRLSGTGD